MMALQNSTAIIPLFDERQKKAKALTAFPNPAARVVVIGQLRTRPLNPESPPRENKNPATISSLFYEQRETAIPTKNAARLNEMKTPNARNPAVTILAGEIVATIAATFSQPRRPTPAPQEAAS